LTHVHWGWVVMLHLAPLMHRGEAMSACLVSSERAAAQLPPAADHL
jgi:hypothetical protein